MKADRVLLRSEEKAGVVRRAFWPPESLSITILRVLCAGHAFSFMPMLCTASGQHESEIRGDAFSAGHINTSLLRNYIIQLIFGVRRSESLCHPKCWICFSFLVSEYMWGNHLLSVAILIAVNNNTPSRWKLLLQKEILRAAKGKESHQQAQGSSYQWNLQKGWKSKAYWLVAMGVLALSAAIASFLRTTCGDKAWI